MNNQSVLLRGVNDTVEAQIQLCHWLLRIKVRPYYLFQCDDVQGTEHLRTSVETGIKIIEGLRGYTSGLAVPTLVIDLPNGGGKVPLQPNYILSQTESELVVRNYKGDIFCYRIVGKIDMLWHITDLLPPGSDTLSCDFYTIYHERSILRF